MKRGFYILLALIAIAGAIYAASFSPPWWKDRGTMPAYFDEIASLEENYEAAKIGQLMNLSAKAAEELNARLKGGAGERINKLVESFPKFSPQDPDGNYQALSAGQLRSVAALFYERLSELPSTYVEFPKDFAQNFKPASEKSLEENGEDDVAVNVGQLKNMFSWRLTRVVDDDSDEDGLPDSWEMKYFGNLTTANGTSCYNGDGISDLQKYLDGLNPILPPANSSLFLAVYTPLE